MVQGRDINLDIQRVVAYRQFCNKLWNAVRFALANLSADKYTPARLDDAVEELATLSQAGTLPVHDAWILSRLAATAEAVNAAMTSHSLGLATGAGYDFWLYELCDYYLELIKPVMNADGSSPAATAAARLSRMTLQVCLDNGLRLLHPYMPFVTEELWQRLPGRGLAWGAGEGALKDPASIMIARFPASASLGRLARPALDADFAVFTAAVRACRVLRQDADIPPSKEGRFTIVASGDSARVMAAWREDAATLVRAPAGDGLTLLPSSVGVPSGCSAGVVSEELSVHLHLKGLVDPAVELRKLAVRAAKVEDDLAKLRKRCEVAGYAEKVPAEVRAANAEALVAFEKQREVVKELSAQYSSWAAAE